MKLFVGLGNPGKKYANNRHNIGFMALNQISTDHSFSSWKHKFQGQISSGTLGMEKIILLKPDTFMNLSGQSVSEAMNFYKVKIEDIIVFHDELDLSPGKIRVKKGGGLAGHNGLKSIAEHIGFEFSRIRIGIGHPGEKKRVTSHVLNNFSEMDKQLLNPLLDAVTKHVAKLIKGDDAGFISGVTSSIASLN